MYMYCKASCHTSGGLLCGQLAWLVLRAVLHSPVSQPGPGQNIDGVLRVGLDTQGIGVAKPTDAKQERVAVSNQHS